MKPLLKHPPTITSRSNARVKVLRASFSGKASQPGEMVGIQGEILIQEALRSGVRVETLFCREDSLQLLEAVAPGVSEERSVVLSQDVFDSAVGTISPQGIAAIVVIPERRPAAEGVVLMLEDLQDPGNLGTLLRSAEAFDVRQVFVTHATVNAWNSKAVRASAGSVFRLPVTRCTLEQMRAWATERGVRIAAAVAREEGATNAMQARLLAPCALMIGNEGAGLSQTALSLCDERVHIPCGVESLNAAIAGSTLMYEAMRQTMLAQSGGAR